MNSPSTQREMWRTQTDAIFIGYDPREDEAYQVCVASILGNLGIHPPPQIIALDQKFLRAQGLYWRPQQATPLYMRAMERGQPGVDQYVVQYRDLLDGRPFSTEFAFTRFLVPFLRNYQGRAIYCDCDFMFRNNVFLAMNVDLNGAAIAVVKHDHKPAGTTKMDGVSQSVYPRKNWSSFIVWDCGHPSNRRLDLDVVNTWTGRELHNLGWLQDREIVDLAPKWNWLAGYSLDIPPPGPSAVHWTSGGPWLPEYRHAPYADEYRAYLEEKSDG